MNSLIDLLGGDNFPIIWTLTKQTKSTGDKVESIRINKLIRIRHTNEMINIIVCGKITQ